MQLGKVQKLLSLLLCGAMLCSCGTPAGGGRDGGEDSAWLETAAFEESLAVTQLSLTASSESAESSAAEGTSAEESSEESAEEVEESQETKAPSTPLTPRELISRYFDQLYDSYVSLSYPDITDILDMEQPNNQNCVTWNDLLIMRRKIIQENDYCYVETQRYPYTITYIDESDLTDKRMTAFNNRKKNGFGETAFHFTITGQKGLAYPPVLAVNTQHSILMKQIDGEWKITFHYFPGAYRKFSHEGTVQMQTKEEMEAKLRKEFAQSAGPAAISVPGGARAYNGVNAARYAKTYTEIRNSNFYDVGDWMGNCANFTSQCIWYGFTGDGENNPSPAGKPNMTSKWYGGDGGGTPAWENVSSFWDYATASSELKCQIVDGYSALKVGDMIQTKSSSASKFNHTLMVVDKPKMMLAQNSPGSLVYYSDLVDMQTRFLRPVYIS